MFAIWLSLRRGVSSPLWRCSLSRPERHVPGAALDNPVLRTEGRVTFIDGVLASAVLAGLVLNAAVGWWGADPVAGYLLGYYGIREAHAAFTH